VPQVESTAPAPTAVPEPARIFFAVNDAQLPPQAAAALADLAAYLKAVPAARASIVGFHDPSGNAAANDALAKARAQAVSAALQAAGVAGSQLSLDKPEATTGSGAPAEARRVEVSVKP
jgi:outer membrane protein OmpA-like peptidoglycan-associated protein